MEKDSEGLNQVVEGMTQGENEMAQNDGEGIKFKPLGQINQEKAKKKKGKIGVVIFVLLLLSAIVGGLAYYYLGVYTNPKVVYSQIIKAGVNNIMAPITEETTTFNGNVKLDVDINLDESYMEDGVEEIIDTINNIDASVNMQIDAKEQKAILKLASNYENEELLNVDMLMDVKNDKAYVELDQFFDKVLEADEVDLTDLKQAFESWQETLENEKSTFGTEINRKKATEILNNEFTKIIKDEYVSKTKEKITIDEKEISADKYTLKMTYQQMVEELTTIFENLKNNEDFLNCFDEKEELKETIEDAIEDMKDTKAEQESILYVEIYRTGLKQENVRIDFEIESDREKLVVKIEKINDKYGFDVIFEEEEVCTGTFKLQNLDKNTSELNLVLELKEFGKFAVNAEYGYTINEEIDTMDIENAVSTEELSQADMLRATANLQESKLYELIEKFSSLLGEDDNNLIEQPELPTVQPDDSQNEEASDIEKNISSNGILTEGNRFIVFATNNNTVAVDMDIEVEYYDENGIFVGSTQEYLTAVGAGREVAVEMWDPPAVFSTYKIYIEAEKTEEKDYFDQIEMTNNNNGQNIVVQVKNNSDETIDYITVAVVYYAQGKVVGITDGIASEVKTGRAGNFTLHYPYDSNYENVQFDEYKVLVTEAYSYNW